jgi:uncharacterized membrane protein YqhA
MEQEDRARRAARATKVFERILWSSRLLALVPVVASLVVAIALFVFASVDVLGLCATAVEGISVGGEAMHQARGALVAHVVGDLDVYLIATFMLLCSMGIYELFIGKIDAAEGSHVAERLLVIRDLDDLKDRLGKLLVLILAVLFLEHGMELSVASYLDLLLLGLGIAVTAAALFVAGKHRGSV